MFKKINKQTNAQTNGIYNLASISIADTHLNRV